MYGSSCLIDSQTIPAAGHFLACADFLASNHALKNNVCSSESITLPNAVRIQRDRLRIPHKEVFGGDCTMHEIRSKQESSAQVSSAAKKFVVECPEHGHRQARGSRMTIADRLLAETTSETERIRIKRMFFKMTGSCEV